MRVQTPLSALVPLRVIANTGTLESSLININNGALVLTSTDHPIYVHNSTYTGWERDPRNLRIGDSIYNAVNHEWVSVFRIQSEDDSTLVYDIVDAGAKDFIANGYLLLDK